MVHHDVSYWTGSKHLGWLSQSMWLELGSLN
jgi:hypothetical protein